MAKVYECMHGKFTITKHDNCSIKVTHEEYDEFSVTISADKLSDNYIIKFLDEWRSLKKESGAINIAIDLALKMINERVNYKSKYEKLCSSLNEFYNKLPDKA